MASVLDWMDSPGTGTGIRFKDDQDGWDRVSYADLTRQAGRIAALLHEHGVRRDDVVIVLADRPRTFVPAFLGVLAAGATAAPVAGPLTFRSAEYVAHVARLLRIARPTAVLADSALIEAARSAVHSLGEAIPVIALEQAPDTGDGFRTDPAATQLLQFTSGSSGTPKAVRVSADNLYENVRCIHRWLGVTEQDVCASWLPTYHDMGLIGTFVGSLVAQVDLWMMAPVNFVRSPLAWLELFGRHGATVTASPNFGYALTARRVRPEQLEGMDFSGWRVAMSGAERVDTRVMARFVDLLAPHGFSARSLVPAYGLAEATLAVSGGTPGQDARTVTVTGGLIAGKPVSLLDGGVLGRDPGSGRHLSSCGRPAPGVRVDIVDDEGTVLPAGSYGEIRVQGPSVAQGYLSEDPHASAGFTADGLLTGDGGFLLDGEVFVVGRVGDSLKVRGRTVHAEDLESRLTDLEGIGAGRSTVALGTEAAGNHAVLLVESTTDEWLAPALAAIRTATDEELYVSVLCVPKGAIPRTSSGKPRRRFVWQSFTEGAPLGRLVHGGPR
jgi:acyl-CoA synthetase (AMP-forming)/AMP-acid ligase II